MAISTAAHSPKEFQFLIAEQDAFGTLEAGGGNAYHALDDQNEYVVQFEWRGQHHSNTA